LCYFIYAEINQFEQRHPQYWAREAKTPVLPPCVNQVSKKKALFPAPLLVISASRATETAEQIAVSVARHKRP
jgi:hypothetical protein